MKTIKILPNSSIQKVLDTFETDELIKIKLSPGIYHEKITVNCSNIIIEGSSKEDTIITYSDYNYKIHEDGQIYNTFRTPTLNILGKNVVLKNLTIRNDSGKGKDIGQAIALSVYGDNFTADNCSFHSYQDTIFCGPLPQDLTIRYKDFLPLSHLHTNNIHCYFKECLITGAVDFIFGSAFAIFTNSIIRAIDKGYIVAPSTYQFQEFGFVFIDCVIENVSKSVDVFLARPWRNHGSTCFINCNFKGSFNPERYDLWDKEFYRFYESPLVDSKYVLALPEMKEEQLRKRRFYNYSK